MRLLDYAGVAMCLLLLGIAAYLPLHERHPLDLLIAAALAVFALTTMAMIAGLKHILLAWFILAGLAAAFVASLRKLRRPAQDSPESPSVHSPT